MNELRFILSVLVRENTKKSHGLLASLFPYGEECKEYALVKTLLNSIDNIGSATAELESYSPNVKSRVKKKLESALVNHYFSAQQSDSINREKLYFLSKSSFQKKEFKLAIKFCKEGIRNGKKNQEIESITQFLSILYRCYVYEDMIPEASKTNLDLIKYNKVHSLECEAQCLYQHIEINLIASRKKRIQTIDMLDDYLIRIKEIADEAQTNKALTILYNITVLKHKTSDHPDELLKFLQGSEQQIQHLSEFESFEIFNHIINKAEALLKSKRLTETISYIEKNIPKFPRNSKQWFEIHLIYLIALMHNKDYTSGDMVLNKILINPSYHKMTDDLKDYLKLCKAYLYFALPGKKISNHLSLDDIYNGFSEFSKDKLGNNCHLILLEFLYYIESYKSEVALDRKESLQNYLYKNLKNSSVNQREVLLFKLIIISIDTNFNFDKSKQRGKELAEQLSNEKKHFISYQDSEIIPYEHLWSLLLIKMLKKSSYY